MKKISLRVLFIFIALFFVFILKSNVKAMTFTHNDVEYNLPDLPEVSANFDGVHYSIYSFNGGFTLLTYVNYTDNSSYVYTNNAGSFGLSNDGNSSGRIKIWHINSESNVWYMQDWQPEGYYFGYYRGEFDSTNFIYSTVDIYGAVSADSPDVDTVLFPQATSLILRPVVAKQRAAMSTILQEIINILPMILVVLVSYIGLRKALMMLWSLLHQA